MHSTLDAHFASRPDSFDALPAHSAASIASSLSIGNADTRQTSSGMVGRKVLDALHAL